MCLQREEIRPGHLPLSPVTFPEVRKETNPGKPINQKTTRI